MVENRYFVSLQRMLHYMETHLQENITVRQIAQSAGYSPWHCSRIFKEYIGESPGVYLRKMRLMRGYQMLYGTSVKEVAGACGFSSMEGFSKAFCREFGIYPSQMKKEKIPGKRVYEWKNTEKTWGKGGNPTENGLWQFEYFDPVSNRYGLMKWSKNEFCAPFETEDSSDPFWYCLHRNRGYGMHPGRVARAVKTFVCPEDGRVEFFLSAGRLFHYRPIQEGVSPSRVQVLKNETELTPFTVLIDTSPVQFRMETSVKQGDKLRFVLDSMGDAVCDGLMLYRQWISYID